jgi:glucosylceramidase
MLITVSKFQSRNRPFRQYLLIFYFKTKQKGTLKEPVGGIYYQTWANYYVKFFQAYKNFGIEFWAMTTQNEPSDGYLFRFSFNAMGFTPETQAAFLTQNLGPTLRKSGFDSMKIMILDDQRLFLPNWPERVLKYSPEASKYVDGIAVHWYLDSVVPAKSLDLTHEKFPDKWIFGTEACAGAGPLVPNVILGGFDRADNYAKYMYIFAFLLLIYCI